MIAAPVALDVGLAMQCSAAVDVEKKSQVERQRDRRGRRKDGDVQEDGSKADSACADDDTAVSGSRLDVESGWNGQRMQMRWVGRMLLPLVLGTRGLGLVGEERALALILAGTCTCLGLELPLPLALVPRLTLALALTSTALDLRLHILYRCASCLSRSCLPNSGSGSCPALARQHQHPYPQLHLDLHS